MDGLKPTTLTLTIILIACCVTGTNARFLRFPRFKPPGRGATRLSGDKLNPQAASNALDLATTGVEIGLEVNHQLGDGNSGSGNHNNLDPKGYENDVEETTSKPGEPTKGQEDQGQQQQQRQQWGLQHDLGGRDLVGGRDGGDGEDGGVVKTFPEAPEASSTTKRTARSARGKGKRKNGLRSKGSRRGNSNLGKQALDATVSAADKFFNPDGIDLDYNYDNDYNYDYQQPRGIQQQQPQSNGFQGQWQTYQQRTIIPPERQPTVTLQRLRKLAAEHDLELDEDEWDEVLTYGGSGLGTGALIVSILWKTGLLDKIHGCLCNRSTTNAETDLKMSPLSRNDSKISIVCTGATVSEEPSGTSGRGRYSGGSTIEE